MSLARIMYICTPPRRRRRRRRRPGSGAVDGRTACGAGPEPTGNQARPGPLAAADASAGSGPAPWPRRAGRQSHGRAGSRPVSESPVLEVSCPSLTRPPVPPLPPSGPGKFRSVSCHSESRAVSLCARARARAFVCAASRLPVVPDPCVFIVPPPPPTPHPPARRALQSRTRCVCVRARGGGVSGCLAVLLGDELGVDAVEPCPPGVPQHAVVPDRRPAHRNAENRGRLRRASPSTSPAVRADLSGPFPGHDVSQTRKGHSGEERQARHSKLRRFEMRRFEEEIERRRFERRCFDSFGPQSTPAPSAGPSRSRPIPCVCARVCVCVRAVVSPRGVNACRCFRCGCVPLFSIRRSSQTEAGLQASSVLRKELDSRGREPAQCECAQTYPGPRVRRWPCSRRAMPGSYI